MKKILGILIILVILAGAGGFWWFKNSSGSIEYLIPLIEKALNPKNSDYHTTMQDIKLEWNQVWSWPKVKIENIKTEHIALGEVLRIEEVQAQIDLKAMLSKELQLKSIHIQNGKLTTQNIPKDTSDITPWSRSYIASLLSSHYQAIDSLTGIYHGLKFVTMDNFQINLNDALSKSWEIQIKQGRLELAHNDFLQKADFESLIQMDGIEQSLQVKVERENKSQAPDWEIKLRQLPSSLIQHFAEEIDSLEHLGYLDIDLRSSIFDSTFLNPTLEIRSDLIQINSVKFFDQEQQIQNLVIHTRWNDQFQEAYLENSELTINQQKIQLSGKVDPFQVSATLNLRHPDLDLPWLEKNWPKSFIPPARQWIFDHIQAGNFYESSLIKNSQQTTALAQFAKLKVAPWQAIPNVSQAKGNILWSLDSNSAHHVEVQVNQAKILNSQLKNIQVKLTPIHHPKEEMDLYVKASLSGSLQDALAIIDEDIIKTDSLPVIFLSGQHQSELKLKVPLEQKIDLKNINLNLTTNGSNTQVKLRDKELPIDQVNLKKYKLSLKSSKLRIEGDGDTENQDFQFKYSMDIDQKTSQRPTLKIQANTHTNKIKKWVDQDIASGPLQVDATISLPNSESNITKVEVAGTLNQTQLVVGGKLIKKASANKSKLMLKLSKIGQKINIPQFDIIGKDLTLESSGQLHLDSKNFEFQVDKLKSGVALLLHEAKITKTKSHIDLKGNFLNLHRFMDLDTLDSKVTSANTELLDESAKSHLQGRIDLTFNKIQMTPQGYLKNVKTKTHWNKGKLKDLGMFATFGKNKQVNAKFLKETKHPTIEIRTNDAGSFLRTFEYYNHMYEGELKIQLTAPGGFLKPKYRAEFQVKNFRIAEAPTLSKIVAIGSFVGIGDAFSGKGTRFHRAKGSADLHLGKIKVNPIYAQGPSVSIYTYGEVDTNAKHLQLQGNVIPFTLFNESLGLKFVVSDRPSLREPNVDVQKLSKIHSEVKAQLKALERQQ